MDADTSAQVAHVAIWVAWLTGGGLCLAVLGAACEAMFPGSLVWSWVGFLSGLSVALRLFLLVTLLDFAWRVLVTYVHVGRARHTLVTRGRHRPSYVRTHPASTWQARGAA